MPPLLCWFWISLLFSHFLTIQTHQNNSYSYYIKLWLIHVSSLLEHKHNGLICLQLMVCSIVSTSQNIQWTYNKRFQGICSSSPFWACSKEGSGQGGFGYLPLLKGLCLQRKPNLGQKIGSCASLLIKNILLKKSMEIWLP